MKPFIEKLSEIWPENNIHAKFTPKDKAILIKIIVALADQIAIPTHKVLYTYLGQSTLDEFSLTRWCEDNPDLARGLFADCCLNIAKHF